LARQYRKAKAAVEHAVIDHAVIDNDNLHKVMDEVQTRKLEGKLLFSIDGSGKKFQVSSPDVTCDLSFSGSATSLLSDPYAPQDLPEGELAKLEGHTAQVIRIAFDKSGERLASTGGDHMLLLWNVAERSQIGGFRTEGFVTALAFMPDGKRLALGDGAGRVGIWDASTGQAVQRFAGHTGVIPGITSSPDGRRLATASHDGTVKVWLVEP
jgi:WD40 repeat protein